MRAVRTKNFYQELDRLFAEKKIAQVEPFLQKTLAEAESEGAYDLAVAACNELGGFFRGLSRYEEGIALYEKALRYLKELGMENDENCATTLINYATILNLAGRADAALERYEEAIRMLRSCGIEADYRIAALHNNMSGLYRKKADLYTAAAYLRKALLILEQLSESEVEIAITYSNLANVYREIGRLDTAQEYAEKSVRLFSETSGDQDVHYAAAVCALAEVHFAQGQYADAAALFAAAAKLTERDYGTENDTYRTITRNLQLCDEAMAKKREFQENEQKKRQERERV